MKKKQEEEIKSELAKHVKAVPCKYFDQERVFDLKEHAMMGILYGLKRTDIITQMQQMSDAWGVPSVPEKRFIELYNQSRDSLFTYRMGTIEQEKVKFLERMYRLGAKAEARGDFNNAFKAYDKIAQIAGVYAESDDTKVILNFVPVRNTTQRADVVLNGE